jgi:hypothetical protein
MGLLTRLLIWPVSIPHSRPKEPTLKPRTELTNTHAARRFTKFVYLFSVFSW